MDGIKPKAVRGWERACLYPDITDTTQINRLLTLPDRTHTSGCRLEHDEGGHKSYTAREYQAEGKIMPLNPDPLQVTLLVAQYRTLCAV